MLSRLLSASGTKRSKVVCDFLSAPVCWFLFVKERVKYAKITKKYVFKCVFFLVTAQRRDTHLTKEQESRLPTHWLKSKGAHTTMVDALWRLRDLMLRDSLNICQTYNL